MPRPLSYRGHNKSLWAWIFFLNYRPIMPTDIIGLKVKVNYCRIERKCQFQITYIFKHESRTTFLPYCSNQWKHSSWKYIVTTQQTVRPFKSYFQQKHMLWVLKKTIPMTQVVFSNQNICLNWWIKKCSQFYTIFYYLSAPMQASR